MDVDISICVSFIAQITPFICLSDMLNYLSGSELIYLGISVPYSGPFVDVHFNVALHASVSHEYLISH